MEAAYLNKRVRDVQNPMDPNVSPDAVSDELVR
jgi:hypothetical protein